MDDYPQEQDSFELDIEAYDQFVYSIENNKPRLNNLKVPRSRSRSPLGRNNSSSSSSSTGSSDEDNTGSSDEGDSDLSPRIERRKSISPIRGRTLRLESNSGSGTVSEESDN